MRVYLMQQVIPFAPKRVGMLTVRQCCQANARDQLSRP